LDGRGEGEGEGVKRGRGEGEVRGRLGVLGRRGVEVGVEQAVKKNSDKE
jgi:hypothetical protein